MATHARLSAQLCSQSCVDVFVRACVRAHLRAPRTAHRAPWLTVHRVVQVVSNASLSWVAEMNMSSLAEGDGSGTIQLFTGGLCGGRAYASIPVTCGWRCADGRDRCLQLENGVEHDVCKGKNNVNYDFWMKDSGRVDKGAVAVGGLTLAECRARCEDGRWQGCKGFARAHIDTDASLCDAARLES